MKKISKNEMENISAGMKCGWVGVILGTGLIFGIPGNSAIIAPMAGEIKRCWNS